MRTELELTLSHDGHRWITDVLNNQLCGKDLNALDDLISAAIQNDCQFDKDNSVKVQLRFDMDTIPRWLHQYHSHYFNYTFTVNKWELD